MIVVVYIVSAVVFCIGSFVLPLLLMPVTGAIHRASSNGAVLSPTHPLFLAPFVISTVFLLYLTRYVWGMWGYDPGWLFPTIIAVLHVVLGGAKGANMANQAQAFGVVLGVVVYGVTRLF